MKLKETMMILLCALVASKTPMLAQTHTIHFEVRVFEPGGHPVGDALVTLSLPRYAQGKNVNVTALTNDAGVAQMQGKVLFDYVLGAEKAGYYNSTAPKVELASDAEVKRGVETIQRVALELRPIKRPVAMLYGGTKMEAVRVPNKWGPAGYDLIVGDWIAPWGKGNVADLIFQVAGEYRSSKFSDCTLTVQFPSRANGIIPFDSPARSGSDFKFPYEAPLAGYETTHVWHRAIGPGAQNIDQSDSRRYLIRIRSEVNSDGTIQKALYGFFWSDVEFLADADAAGIRFNYAVNPTGERDIEFDKTTSTRVQSEALGSLASPSSPVKPAPPIGHYQPWPGGRATDRSDPRWAELREREKRDPKWQGKMPIDFFGKVLDFEGNPVAGATAKFRWTDLTPAGSTEATTTSDAQGNFSLHGVEGKYLGVEVVKDGYYTSRHNRFGFEFAFFSDAQFYQPEAEHPVIYRLKKKGETEPLIYHHSLYGLKTDGTPQFINLRNGEKSTAGVANGDLELSLSRGAANADNQFNWELRLAGVANGGLIESQDEYMFQAPTTDYQKEITIREVAGGQGYERHSERSYFVRLADGRTFGRITADIRPRYNDEQGAVGLTIYVNPSGSRNLELNPEKVAQSVN